jgi:uncharacterized repeat protein (TIGR02543 family)
MRIGATLYLAALLGSPALADVQLNEFLAANTQVHPDVVDFEDYPDWIELKNTTGSPINLAGYYLSDDPLKPFKWPFPGSASIAANGFLVVWADGHDAIPGQSRPRGYWPWRNFTTEGYHTNFSLSSDGEGLVLTKATGIATTNLVNAAVPAPVLPATVATWKYLDDGSNQSTQWRARTFDDAGWASGPSELGYADSPATTVSYGPSSASKYITTYFRHTFQVADPALIASLSLKLLVDDGAVVYLNGEEVVRKNLPAGEISHLTLATLAVGGTDETTFSTFNLPASGLLPGDNVLAVEVHQSAGNSSDLSFDLGLTATTFTGSSTLDSLAYTTQVDDVSRGRNPSLNSQWVNFAVPTPGAVNSGTTVPDLRVPGVAATVSLDSGFHASPQSVTLSAASGNIHYTLDGSLPRITSPQYAAPLSINATTVLRARVFQSGKPPGPVETRTYFIGETPGAVPYVSVVADPDALFGAQKGIYYNQHEPLVSSTSNSALGLRDAYKGKDAPGSLEFFAPGGTPGFRVNGGFRIGGENNWVHGQRALNFALRGKYGDDEIKYDLFPESGIPLHTGLTLRDGGDNWASDMLRDGMWPFIARGRMKADTSDFRPAVVFINGAYWGIHDIRARWDDQWFFEHKRVNADDVDHLLYGHVDSTAVSLGIEKGNADDWLDLMSFLESSDLSQPANYAFAESRIDIDSFIDFVVAESYAINTSWNHNREFWRDRNPGSKWRWFLPDMDRTFQTSSLGTSVLNSMLGGEDVLVHLKDNPTFKNRLAQRFAAHVASTFKPARINGIIDQMAAESDAEIPRHAARWAAYNGTSVVARANAIQDVKNFMATRDGNIHAELQARLGVSAPVNLTLGVDQPAGGRVLICGVPVGAGVVKMFPNIAFDLKAEAAPGYTFTGWTGASGGASTAVTLTGAAAITANFAVSGETVTGGTLAASTALSLAGSPYTLSDDLIVPAGMTLTIGPGVELRMPAGRNLRVQGSLQVQGTALQPVQIIGRNGEIWGGISFENPGAPSHLDHLILRGASRGHDPTVYPYAISGLNATLVMDFIDIDDSEGPIFARGGSTILRDSRLRTPYTGDCINIKGGYAETRDCVFMGNNAPDTDAIDYDGVIGGIIANNRIYRFQGPNSDGVDIGEECSGVVIEGNLIYYNSDKGFSVGQGSTVTIRRNLVVGCTLGVGVKDSGSVATIDQNTFVDCGKGVDVYEKNFGSGGGTANIENTIFSRCQDGTVSADALSDATVIFSLSDTVAMAGNGNQLADPDFLDRSLLNFQLKPGSPAINAGRLGHAPDPDGSRADIGALYVYSPDHYPFVIGNTVVIEEVFANSGLQPDWIELHNRSSAAVDIGGWFLSDSGANLAKYRIPAGTVIPAGGYLVFDEEQHFGSASIDPGRISPFGISATGETVYLSSAVNDQITDYQAKEDFGASLEGETLGNYYKPSSGSWNFVALAAATPGAPNRGPRIGPVVISEVNYQPGGHADSEYFELLNISDQPVALYDSLKGAAWRISDGVEHEFPAASPIVMAAGERIILTKSLTRFNAAFNPPPGTRVFEWTAGRLSNEGEQLQIARPAGLDGANVRQFARVDRVSYEIASPWPAAAAGGGPALTKVAEEEYGNDFANWIAATANPGSGAPGSSFASWIGASGLPLGERDPDDDPDRDGRSNFIEYALGSSAAVRDAEPPFGMAFEDGRVVLDYAFRIDRPGAVVAIEHSADLGAWERVDSTAISLSPALQERRAEVPMAGRPRGFFRLSVTESAP